MRIAETIGNTELWARQATLFLCSKLAPLACYERVFQWVESLTQDDCVVCFNTSELEEEVLQALLVCKVPTILVVTQHFHYNYNVQIERALEEKRMLIVVLLREADDKGYTAKLRNQYVIGIAKHIVCGPINITGINYGLIAGLKNVTYLVGDKMPVASDTESKPFRWTVGEDKMMLRMFYEDLGLHAIHKALGRPYSTVYTRMKTLGMKDETLIGLQFEEYVVTLLGLPKNKKVKLLEWRGDKSMPGIYPENNSEPDLLLEYDGKRFAVECKWRNHMPRVFDTELLPENRRNIFLDYSQKNNTPVYMLVGIGGLPSEPDNLYLAEVTNHLTLTELKKGLVATTSNLIDVIVSILTSTFKPF